MRSIWKLTSEERNTSELLYKKLRYLWIYSSPNEHSIARHQLMLKERRAAGFDINAICTTMPEFGYRWFPFFELDKLWVNKDKILMDLYEKIASLMNDCDVMILYNGANLHPDFVRQLTGFKVYTFADPESWNHLAGPTASAFDMHFAHQFSEISRFQRMGLKDVHFCPLGTRLFRNQIVQIVADVKKEREIPVVLFCGRTQWRNDRLDEIVRSFPDATVRGSGWPLGRVTYDEMDDIYRRSGIGWNVHNTTGFNFRTYDLAAYGVMQISDCKSDLSKIFNTAVCPDLQIIGYETAAECIEKTKYYLSHQKEQRIIATNALQHCLEHYTPDAVWEYMARRIAISYRNNRQNQLLQSSLEINGDKKNKPLVKRTTRGDWYNYIRAPLGKSFQSPLESLFDDYLALNKSLNVIEIGAGRGGHLASLVRSHGYSPVILDYHPDVYGLAKEFKDNGLREPEVFCEDFCTWKPPQTYDVVMSIDFVQYFDNYEDCLRKQWEIVSDGGCLVVGVPVLRNFQWIRRVLFSNDEPTIWRLHASNRNLMKQGELNRIVCALPNAEVLGSRLLPYCDENVEYIDSLKKERRQVKRKSLGRIWSCEVIVAKKMTKKGIHS